MAFFKVPYFNHKHLFLLFKRCIFKKNRKQLQLVVSISVCWFCFFFLTWGNGHPWPVSLRTSIFSALRPGGNRQLGPATPSLSAKVRTFHGAFRALVFTGPKKKPSKLNKSNATSIKAYLNIGSATMMYIFFFGCTKKRGTWETCVKYDCYYIYIRTYTSTIYM